MTQQSWKKKNEMKISEENAITIFIIDNFQEELWTSMSRTNFLVTNDLPSMIIILLKKLKNLEVRLGRLGIDYKSLEDEEDED